MDCSLPGSSVHGIFQAIILQWGASLVAQRVKNLPAMQKTRIRSLGREEPLEEGMAIHSSILAWRIHMDRGAWWAMVHVVTKSQTRLKSLSTILEWVDISSSRGSSQSRDRTHVACLFCIGKLILYHCATWKAKVSYCGQLCDMAITMQYLLMCLFAIHISSLVN